MTSKEFDELIKELNKSCFTVESGMYYSEYCLELDDVISILKDKLKVNNDELKTNVNLNDCGTFVAKVVEEYEFAKSKEFDSIVIAVETSGGEYEISEYEDGFINDNLDGVYSELDEISSDLFSLISMNNDKVEGFRIE